MKKTGDTDLSAVWTRLKGVLGVCWGITRLLLDNCKLSMIIYYLKVIFIY